MSRNPRRVLSGLELAVAAELVNGRSTFKTARKLSVHPLHVRGIRRRLRWYTGCTVAELQARLSKVPKRRLAESILAARDARAVEIATLRQTGGAA